MSTSSVALPKGGVATIDSADEELERNVLGTHDIVFMVLAAAAPLAVVMALMPISFALGNGAGVPGAWIVGGIAMLLFAVGYVRQIPYIKNAGAFYAYISTSFSRLIGLPAAYIATLSYLCLCLSTIIILGYFVADLFNSLTGLQSSWQLWSGLGTAIVAVLAYHRITMVATVLAIALVAEIGLLLLLDGAIIYQNGFSAFNISDLSPDVVFAPGLGVAMIYAFTSLFGIEGTAIYQEEARSPKVTVPRATFISVVIAVMLYALTAWCLSTAVGSHSVARISASDPGHFVSNLARAYLGNAGAASLQVFVITSAFASVLGLFNCGTRYVYALARDGVLPHGLARTHPKYHSPHIAGILLAGICFLVLLVTAFTGLDPLQKIAPMFIGIGSLGLMALLAITSIGVPLFFARRGEFGWGKSVAPLFGGIAIGIATFLAATNYSILTGVEHGWINLSPLLLVAVTIAGLIQATWLRTYNSTKYLKIGASRVDV